jgi:hypothetical protein
MTVAGSATTRSSQEPKPVINLGLAPEQNSKRAPVLQMSCRLLGGTLRAAVMRGAVIRLGRREAVSFARSAQARRRPIALMSRQGPLMANERWLQQAAGGLPHVGRGEAEGCAIQQVVDEAGREAQCQQRRHER